MKKYLITLLIAVFVSPAFADRRETDDQPGVDKEKKVDQLASELGLSDDQKTKIQASREKYRSQIADREAAFSSAREKFNAVIQNPNASGPELETAFKQKEDAQRALHDTLFQSRMEFRDVLTPEQRTKMISKRDSMREKKFEKKQGLKDKKDEVKGKSAPAR